MADRNAWTRVAVVGCGYWGRNLVRNFAELDALAGIVDRDRAAVAELTAKHGGRALTFAQALADPQIGGIVIAAPAALHYRLASEALAAGKHVLVEKPLSLDVAEAERLCAQAKAANLRLMVGHLLQYHPAYVALKKLVAAGKLGRLTYVYSNRLSLGKIRREEDVLFSFAPHDISMILGLVGEEPSSIGAFAAPVLHPTIADHTQLHLAFPSGVRGHVFVSWLHPFKEHRLVVAGDAGMAVFEDSAADPAKKLLFHPHGIAWKDGAPAPIKGEAEAIAYDTGEPLALECQHFLDSIAAGTDPISDGEEGVRVLRVLARAAAAMAGNAPARFDGVMVHESAYVDEGVEIGVGSKIWHFSHILGRVKLGRKVIVGQNVVIGPDVAVGDNCKIQNNVSLYKGVTLEDGVFCGPSCVFTNVMNPRAEIERKNEFRPTLVKQGATIGANATIVCGNTIGRYAFIGAGSVVTRDVPDFAIMAGVPARRTGWVSRHGEKLGKDLVCPATGTRYREAGANQLEEISQ